MNFQIKIDAQCVSCGTKEEKHKARNMCENCYRKWLRQEKKAKVSVEQEPVDKSS